MKIIYSCLSLFLFSVLISCGSEKSSLSEEEHIAEVEAWYQERATSLKSEEGWLNLIGLYWLKEGETSFGSNPEALFHVEENGFPDWVGTFLLKEGKVFFTPSMVDIFLDGNMLEGETLIFDSEAGFSGKLSYQSLRWNIIKRADAFGVRLRDLEAEAITKFDGIDRYPVSSDWRLESKFVPYEPIREIAITNVLGQTTPNPSPGYLEFEKDGKTHRIEALEDGGELYLIIADNTSGDETYGGGRYMYVKKPTSGNTVILDFNKAYNPPCVFTPHATCPLPPRENILDLAITAGEKNFGSH